MQTVREQSGKGMGPAEYRSFSTQTQTPVSEYQTKRLKIVEFRSWSVCFSVIVVLTGMLKIFKLGITMDSITSFLFFSSLGGLAYFIYRIVTISRSPVQLKANILHELN
jgi:hypothetical protein